MGIRLFNLNFEGFGSLLCAITSVTLIIAALLALLKIGEFAIAKIMSAF
jgi:hypothetical protein